MIVDVPVCGPNSSAPREKGSELLAFGSETPFIRPIAADGFIIHQLVDPVFIHQGKHAIHLARADLETDAAASTRTLVLYCPEIHKDSETPATNGEPHRS